jgi:hypothetical protein
LHEVWLDGRFQIFRQGVIMSLTEKYADLVALAKALGGKEVSSKEEEGKFKLWATLPSQSGKNAMLSTIEGRSGGDDEVVADIRSEQPDPRV